MNDKIYIPTSQGEIDISTYKDFQNTLDSHTEQLNDIAIDVKNYGAKGDNATNDSIAFINANALNGNVFIGNGTYRISSNITIGNLYVSNGGKLSVDAGVTVTIGHVNCDCSTQCFMGAGTIKILDNNYSLAWYAGTSANKKWDFLRRGFTQLQGIQKYVVVPVPKVTDEAYITAEYNCPAWAVDGALYFDDPEDNLTFDSVAQFVAVNGCTDMFVFSPTKKTEEITFPKGLLLEGGLSTNPIANNGIVIHGGARLKFDSVVRTKYFKQYCVIEDCSIASCDEVQFNFLECTCFGIAGLYVCSNGNSPLYGFVNYFYSNGAFSGAEAFIKFDGAVRGFTINKFVENVVVAGVLTDISIAQILISSTASGTSKNIFIKDIYSAYSTKPMIVTRNNGGSQKIVDLRVEHLYSNTSSGLNLAYLINSIIDDVYGTGTLIVNNDCSILNLSRIYITITGACNLLSIDGKLSDTESIATDNVIQVVNLPNGVYQLDTDNSANTFVFVITQDSIVSINAGANINVVANTHLYGTTGTAGKINISFYNGTYLFIENRTGVTITSNLKQL